MSKYWEERIANNTWKAYNNAQERNIELLKMYQKASEDMSKELYSVAEKINGGKDISLSDLHKFNRLSGLQENFNGIVEKLGEKVENISKDSMQEGFKDVYADTSKAINDNPFTIPNKRVMDEILDRPWQGGSFSSRLWKNTGFLASALNEDLTIGLQQGKTIAEISINLANKMQQGFNVTHRLVRTETMHYLNNSTIRAYKDKGVEEIKIWVAKDERLCKHCNSYHDKVYAIDEAPIVPFHANCRCTYLPVIEEENFATDQKRDIIGLKKEIIQDFEKLKSSGMTEDEYSEYLIIINSHNNPYVRQLYSKHADEINCIKLTSSKGAAYIPSSNSLTFNFDNSVKYHDINKYDTLAHEYAHFFDNKVGFDNITFKEIEAVRNATGINATFKNKASSSDEFLEAIRKDKKHIKNLLTPELRLDLSANDASSGVQDAIDGLFVKSRVKWGHGERYYNRKYADIEYIDKITKGSCKKELQKVYKDLGFDVSNQAKVKGICRQYDAASEAWANIMSAEVCGGKTLEYVKKYLPNSYQTMLEILKGVK